MSGKNKTMDFGEFEGGVFVEGVIVGRKKKEFEEKTRVNYQVFTGKTMIIVTSWNSKKFYVVGEKVKIPVRVAVYRSMPQFSEDNINDEGEAF